MKHFMLSTAIAVAVAGGAMASTLTADYTSFWVLGDSLSDNGNLFAATGGTTPSDPPYFEGRFSNGEVWNEPILEEFNAAGLASGNFAFGGARTIGGEAPSLTDQQGLFAANAAPFLGDTPLVSLWIGANDIFAGLDEGNATEVAIEAANAVTDAAQALSGFGVEDFLILNLPDIGETPAYNLFQPDLADAASEATAAYNLQLADNIADLEADGLNVIDIDVFSAFLDPSVFGASDTVLPCIFPSQAAADAFGQPLVCDEATADERLFFDSVHPNTGAHAVLNGIVTDALSSDIVAPVPLPATAPLALFGLAVLGLFGRRRAR